MFNISATSPHLTSVYITQSQSYVLVIFRAGSWVLSRAPHRSSVRTSAGPYREIRATRGWFKDAFLNRGSLKVPWKSYILFYSWFNYTLLLFKIRLTLHLLYPEAKTQWLKTMRCNLLLLWLMSPLTSSPPARIKRTAHRRNNKAAAMPQKRYSSGSKYPQFWAHISFC